MQKKISMNNVNDDINRRQKEVQVVDSLNKLNQK